MVEIGLFGAFLGGTLSLLSPCSALLLPAFFAYAFQSRRELTARTIVFFLGLCTLLVPLGMGAGFAASIVLDRRETAISIAGGLLILFGVLELGGIGFSLLPRRLSDLVGGGRGWFSVYTTGLVYGFAGFCAGPILGSVLTVAAGSGSAAAGAALLMTYALGMVTPLFVLASLWDRYQLGQKPWLRGRLLRIGPLRVHSFNLLTGLLFIALGTAFIMTSGTGSLEGVYERIGLVTLSYRAQLVMERVAGLMPDWAWLAIILGTWAAILGWRRARQR